MIAKVRIAPVERWCDGCLNALRKYPRLADKVGSVIAIMPETMRADVQLHFCDGEKWGVPQEIADPFRESIESRPAEHDAWVCEHALEMD